MRSVETKEPVLTKTTGETGEVSTIINSIAFNRKVGEVELESAVPQFEPDLCSKQPLCPSCPLLLNSSYVSVKLFKLICSGQDGMPALMPGVWHHRLALVSLPSLSSNGLQQGFSVQ